MNFQFNKIAGAVLGTALGVMAVGIVAETIFEPTHSEKPGYVIAVAEPGEGGEGTEGPSAPVVVPIADRLQTASADAGAKDVAKCKTCHTFAKGEPNKVGPNLWGVVGASVVHGDFDFSDAMRAKAEEGMTWTYENLDHFIENPKGFVPGTAMSFAGVKDPSQRADIIAYLRTLADTPEPLPPPTPAPTAEAQAAPADSGNAPAATETAPAATEVPAPAPDTTTEAPAATTTDEAPAAPATAPTQAETPTMEAPAAAPDAASTPDEAPAATETAPAPTETPTMEAPAPAPSDSDATAPADDAGAAPTEPPAEADSPEGAPSETPTDALTTETPAQ
jgi:cytochrome c